jgi:hypothetical protein
MLPELDAFRTPMWKKVIEEIQLIKIPLCFQS